MNPAEKAFQETTSLLFGQPLAGLEKHSEWLSRKVPPGDICNSAIGGKEIYVPRYAAFKEIPRRLSAGKEAYAELSARKIALEDADGVGSISRKLKSIAMFITEFEHGTNLEVQGSTIYLNLMHAYKIVDCFESKHIAYSFFSDNCDHVFGMSKCFNCNFSINCQDSGDLKRCFEADFSKNCSDLLFCHNCENVRDSMFCFNAKSKRYAVANVEVGKEEYLRLKAMLVKHVLGQLEKHKGLKIDIYNVGCSV